jgi:hypothetical protein
MVSRTAWYLARHGILRGMVSRHGMASRAARYPVQHGIPHGMVSHTAVSHTAWYQAAAATPINILRCAWQPMSNGRKTPTLETKEHGGAHLFCRDVAGPSGQGQWHALRDRLKGPKRNGAEELAIKHRPP